MFQPKKTKMTMWIAVTVLLITTTVTLVYAASSDMDRQTSPAQRSRTQDSYQQDSHQSDQYSQAGMQTDSMQLCSADQLIGSDVKSKSSKPSMESLQRSGMNRDLDQTTDLSDESLSQSDRTGDQSTPRTNIQTDRGTGRMTQRDADSVIGTVEELIIDDSQDQVRYVILNSDDKFYPVPWKAFKVKTEAAAGTRMPQSTSERRSTTGGQTATDTGTYSTTPGTTTAPGLGTPSPTGERYNERYNSADPVLYLSMSKQQLQQAPTISSVSVQRLSDAQLKQRIDTFYSQYTEKSSGLMDSSRRVGAGSASRDRDTLTGQAQRDIARAGEAVRDTASDTARDIEQTGQSARDTIAGRTARDTDDTRPGQTDDMDTTAQASAGQVNLFKASEVMGLDVQSTSDADLGSIKDLVIDSREGRIAYSLVSFGGFLNIGGKIAAVPWSSLTVQMQQKVVRLDATEDKLNAVVIEDGDITQLSQQQFSQKIHDNFNVEPYWGVYGFIPGQTGAGAMSAWQANSTYNQKFDASKVTSIEGTIESVSTFEPESGAAPGVQLNVKTDDGKTVIVHAGPKQHIDKQELKFDQGKKIKITGSKVQLDGQTVIIATKVTADDQSVELRDDQGKPRWSQQQDQDMGQQSDRSEPGRQSGRESTPNQNQSNY